KRHQAVNEVTLAEIVEELPKKKHADGTDETVGHDNHYELKYFDQTTRLNRFVSFRKAHSVRLFVLDLCVFQDDGVAKLKLETDSSSNIIPTWQARYAEVSKEAKKAITRYADFAKQRTPRDILKLLIPCSSNGNLFKGKIDPQQNIISYD